jgi:hypothetical protein
MEPPMKLTLSLLAAPALMAGLAFGSVALAPAAQARQPDQAETARITEALRAQGYQQWRKIDLDEGVWEVDDAVDAQSHRHDLRVTPETYRVFLESTADRDATPEEVIRIDQALRAAGFQSHGRIRLDDGLWDVDNAVMADGGRFDLTLEPDSFRILHRDREG